MATRNEKFGIFDFGYIENGSSFITELNSYIGHNGSNTDFRQFNISFYNDLKKGKIKYLNKYGVNCEKEFSHYALYDTGYKNNCDEEIYAYFERINLDKSWTGIYFGTLQQINKEIEKNNFFRIGGLLFDEWSNGFLFLEELSQTTIPERWSYQNHESSIPHPILKSYLENTFNKLVNEKCDDKIIHSDDNKYIIFNSGLLDKFFHDIYIVATKKSQDTELIYWNPFIMKSLTSLTKINFICNGERLNRPEKLPKKTQFFNEITEVIFQPHIPIDRDYDKFTHIIEERRGRFPEDYREKDTTELARCLDNSINYAIAIAERNYKLVVPQYRPQTNKIQLLMPIYLRGSFSKKPDFALVLDLEDGIYTPETILPLDAAYQNARLIAKPDDFWLNPEDI